MNTVPAIKLDTSLIPLVHDYLNTATLEELAFKYNLTEAQVSDFLERKEVRSYIKTFLANYGYVAKKSRIGLLNKIVDEKIRFSEENDIPLTKRDLVEIIKLLQTEDEMLAKDKDLTEESQNVYLQVINELKA